MAAIPNHAIKLENLTPSASIYLGESDNGGIILLDCTVEVSGTTERVDRNVALVMALVGRCCKWGVGSVSHQIHQIVLIIGVY